MGATAAQFREVDGKICNLDDDDWYNLDAHVVQIPAPGCLLVSGSVRQGSRVGEPAMFGLRNYPFNVVDGDKIYGEKVKLVGTMSYTTVLGAKSTIRVLDFGVPTFQEPPPPPLTPAQAAAKAMAEINRQTEKTNSAARLLKWHQEQAAKGSPSAQCSLGLRYLKGDGVPKDETLARTWLQKSASQGNPEAIASLAKLPPKDTHSVQIKANPLPEPP